RASDPRPALDALRRERRAGQRPRLGERLLDVGHRRALQLDAGVPPGVDPAGAIADPALSHAETRDEREAVIHHDRLPVVATEPPEGAVESRRVEAPHLDAGPAQAAPEPAPRMGRPA